MKVDVRAFIINRFNQVFLAMYNHEVGSGNVGKWSCLGGGRLQKFNSDEDALFFQLSKQVKGFSPKNFRYEKLLTRVQVGKVLHHIHLVKCLTNDIVHLDTPEKDILDSKFYTILELQELRDKNKLFFNVEVELFEEIHL